MGLQPAIGAALKSRGENPDLLRSSMNAVTVCGKKCSKIGQKSQKSAKNSQKTAKNGKKRQKTLKMA